MFSHDENTKQQLRNKKNIPLSAEVKYPYGYLTVTLAWLLKSRKLNYFPS